jgi:hypothetical protein
VFSVVVALAFSLDESAEECCFVGMFAGRSSRWKRVSGNMKTTMRKERPMMPVLSHQKLRKPMSSVMAPEMIGPTIREPYSDVQCMLKEVDIEQQTM